MKAIVYERYGPPDVLQLKEVERPTPQANEVLVKVFASSVVQADLFLVTGKSFLARLSSGLWRPKYKIPGIDVAGRIEAVGPSAEQFRPGDDVFGDIGDCGFGSYAEYVAVPEDALALKPANLSFEEAATVPQAALVALQGLRDSGEIRPGHRVLIIGASGGNGTFAVQIAKSFGAEVSGVCSTGSLDLVRSIGADHVIDYTQEHWAESEGCYDLILDVVAKSPLSDYLRALRPRGIYVAVAFNLRVMLRGSRSSRTDGKKLRQLSHSPSVKDLLFMKELLEADQVVPVIDRSYQLGEAAEALRYYGEGHSRGKVVISVEHGGE